MHIEGYFPPTTGLCRAQRCKNRSITSTPCEADTPYAVSILFGCTVDNGFFTKGFVEMIDPKIARIDREMAGIGREMAEIDQEAGIDRANEITQNHIEQGGFTSKH